MTSVRFAAALLIAILLFDVPASHADRGVGINVARIEVTERLAQGGDYDLSNLAVSNTGDESADYEMTIHAVSGQTQHKPDPAWFDFTPQRFSLEPGETQNVSMRLEVPTGADTGDYFAQVHAEIVTEGTGNSVGIAAAAQLSFTVKSSSWFAAQRLRINRYLRDAEPWSYVGAVLFAAGVFTYGIGRYSPVRWRLPFERKR